MNNSTGNMTIRVKKIVSESPMQLGLLTLEKRLRWGRVGNQFLDILAKIFTSAAVFCQTEYFLTLFYLMFQHTVISEFRAPPKYLKETWMKYIQNLIVQVGSFYMMFRIKWNYFRETNHPAAANKHSHYIKPSYQNHPGKITIIYDFLLGSKH